MIILRFSLSWFDPRGEYDREVTGRAEGQCTAPQETLYVHVGEAVVN